MSLDAPRPNETMAKVAAPLYTFHFARMTVVANANGYALALHGSMARDLDVVAIPWTDEAVSAEELIAAFKADVSFSDMRGGEGTDKPHGRRAFNMSADCGLYIDVSVMPRQPLPAPMPSEAHMTDMKASIKGLLDYEIEAALYRGLAQCTCINHSAETERAYDDGRCPHQLARKMLDELPRPPAKREECPECKGKKWVPETFGNEAGYQDHERITCHACKGTGKASEGTATK